MRYLVAELSELALGLAVNIRTLLRLGEVTASGLLALVVSLALNLPTLLKSVDVISIVSNQCHDNNTGEDVVGCNVPRNDILVLPANLVAETANGAVLAAGPQTEDTEGLGNDNALLLVIGRGDTLEDLQALHSSSTAGGLVGNHAADSLVEDPRGSAEVEGTTASGVETGHLAEIGVVLHCRPTKDSILALRSPPIVIRIFPKSNVATTAKKCPPLVRSQTLSAIARNERNRERVERTLRAEELAGDVEGLTSHDDDLLAVEQLLGDSAGQATKEVSLAVDDDL